MVEHVPLGSLKAFSTSKVGCTPLGVLVAFPSSTSFLLPPLTFDLLLLSSSSFSFSYETKGVNILGCFNCQPTMMKHNQTCATTENIEDRDSRPESSSAPKKISQLTFLRSKYIINRSNTALVGQKLQLLNRSINLGSFTLISFTFFLLNLIHCHTFF